MKRQGIKHQMDGLLMLLLFGVFAACVLIVLLTGARAYRGLTVRDAEAFDRRTCVQYLATRVRQGDLAGGVAVESFGDAAALCIKDPEGFVTRVYCHDGWLMELYTFADAELEPQDGEKIMPLEGLALTLEDGFLTAEVRQGEGVTDTLRLSLRAEEGGRL
nr:DUF4860 domain-containing protein [uncultured Oscillibacter sp.]